MKDVKSEINHRAIEWLAGLFVTIGAYAAVWGSVQMMISSLEGTYTFEHDSFIPKLILACAFALVLLVGLCIVTLHLCTRVQYAIEWIALMVYLHQGGNVIFFRKYREKPDWYRMIAFTSSTPSTPRKPLEVKEPVKRNIDRPFTRYSCQLNLGD